MMPISNAEAGFSLSGGTLLALLASLQLSNSPLLPNSPSTLFHSCSAGHVHSTRPRLLAVKSIGSPVMRIHPREETPMKLQTTILISYLKTIISIAFPGMSYPSQAPNHCMRKERALRRHIFSAHLRLRTDSPPPREHGLVEAFVRAVKDARYLPVRCQYTLSSCSSTWD
ncbi:hypothetical protein BO94DRAFT_246602 [Aspergillus sclerotioniger CBS 115572]|uniref:Uncharacterized protein n=1 Tax=Aspergillus sclerotioniger CBS 115572 TaxID=1450535 RepID=A0A317VKR9_9EURO|nr:hypothetical protein BO94DRAFT_246602 [Aspergillus sclerotioniger CBS 115572]PWY72520.1 hypothetical protein BO94DRAFT_246602 [Aspergillus sclerotioniger CBS 115572]